MLSHRYVLCVAVFNFVSDFRQELPYVLSFPQYFKQHGYTVLGHGKMCAATILYRLRR